MHSSEPSRIVGLVGLGLVGTALAQRLLAAGFTVHGFDLRDEARDTLRSLGGVAEPGVREIGAQCGCVVLAVFDTNDVIGVLEGPGGLLSPGHVVDTVIDCSTGTPDALQALAARLEES